MTDELNPTREETNDPFIPREKWRPAVWEFFLQLAESYPEYYDLVAILRDDFEMFHPLVRLGDARRSVIESTVSRLLGVLHQAYWRREGFTPAELALDGDGDVIAVILPERFFGSEKPHLKRRLAGAWAMPDESFCSPDGRPVYLSEELARLKDMSDVEQIAFLSSRLH
jgi:hypothetical protein